MSSLFDALTIARSGVLTQQDRLSVISNNIANVDTQGYHRQRAALGTNPPNDPNLYTSRPYELGTGVHMMNVTRAYNDMREGVYLGQNSSFALHTQLADSLSDLQALLQGDEDSFPRHKPSEFLGRLAGRRQQCRQPDDAERPAGAGRNAHRAVQHSGRNGSMNIAPPSPMTRAAPSRAPSPIPSKPSTTSPRESRI